MKYRSLSIQGAVLDKAQLENYLEKMASDQTLQNYSSRDTYPIPKLKENFTKIEEVYKLLDNHIKLGLPIHPAGEWLLDNFYMIEETVKGVIKNLTCNKYKKFIGIANGNYQGFARIYVLAFEIVSYLDFKIDSKNISSLIYAYQKKKNLSMEEIWNISLFMQIALIQGISDICEKIYSSQMQKYRVENILERLVENKDELKYKNLSEYKVKVKGYGEMKYPFIEYLSHRLKQYGKVAVSFLNVLEEQVNKMGTSIDDVIKKEHFDIAVKKVSMANAITSIKELLRIDFLSIFEEVNKVEDILKKDPANIYHKMDYKTKEYYREAIRNISKKTKISELYIAHKVLDLCENEKTDKKRHVGYYLISKGKKQLYDSLETHIVLKEINERVKSKLYIFGIWIFSFIISVFSSYLLYRKSNSVLIGILFFVFALIPIQESIKQIVQYILGKIVKPKLIPKLDFQYGIPDEYRTIVVIPTIIKNREKVDELLKRLEAYYCANKSENIYFALLGDCSSGTNKEEPFDKEVIEEGIKKVKELNEKYLDNIFPKFSFIYRKRFWNGKEECYLGWERKRGLLTQFNEYILGKEDNVFLVNTIETWRSQKNAIPNFKYVITLDSDTKLTLNTGLRLVGAMSHILNTPVLSEKKDLVIDGHALMQPRVGIDLESARKSLFSKIFSGISGTDSYTNAISDIYQDNFSEGIFTGKGIYDLKVFSEILKNEIPEDKILSHDLLEGSYLRCALTTDIMLMDGYPANYNSYRTRQARWIRGDFQISRWICGSIINRLNNKKNNPLGILSKYKILDNLVRAITPISIIMGIIMLAVVSLIIKINVASYLIILVISILMPMILDILNKIIYRRDGQTKQKNFENSISEMGLSILRGILELSILPDKAYIAANSMIKTIYRLCFSHMHLLEWITSEEAEKTAKTDLMSYYKNMIANTVAGIMGIIISIIVNKNWYSAILFIISLLWLTAPIFMWYISKSKIIKKEQISKQDKEYIMEIAKRTWQFFKDYLTPKNNYLPPDNIQEDRNEKEVNRTSSTNIGLALLSVISSYDLGFETLEDTLNLLQKMLSTIEILPKWNGHLYNWYNIQTLEPLLPRYISTVDSGNFIGYVYVLKQFYSKIKNEGKYLDLIPDWVDKPISEIPFAKADFSKLYDEEKRLFSIGFNIEENKLTNSYYDLLASEARQTSLVAIAKNDISPKHWYNLGRTLTTKNNYKGLISWSGTAFEYLMPNINIKKYEGSLLDESCKFMLMNQKEYAKKLGIPWGFSETAFYVKDLDNNYQYKAIGIPWLGLKRGLEDDIVVASYASVMAINEDTKQVIKNLKRLEKQNMYNKYGFYESIDYTPSRLSNGKEYQVIKTYMAHHQALILLSINNYFNNNILQERFHDNPEIEAIDVLLQERMPESITISQGKNIKPEKIKYVDYEGYSVRVYNKINEKLNKSNVISSNNYTVIMDQKANGYSKYNDIFINRFKTTDENAQGIFFYLKNIKSKRIWTSGYSNYLSKPDKYEITFTEDMDKISRIDGNIETVTKVCVSPKDAVEIRKIELLNNGIEEEILEITGYIEPVLSKANQDYSHPAFNNLFLVYEYIEELNTIIVKRKKRVQEENEIYMAVTLYFEGEESKEIEYEIDKEKFYGRGNFKLPDLVENSKPFSKKVNLVTDPIIAMRKTIKIGPEERKNIDLILCIGETKEQVIEKMLEYQNEQVINKSFELSKAKVEAQTRYLGLKAKQIETYQNLLSYLIYQNPLRQKYMLKNTENLYPQSKLWRYGISGDLPILLIKISQSNDIYVLEDILKAYEYYRIKNIQIDLVIINEEPNSYEKYLKDAINSAILNKGIAYMLNQKGGIFVLEDVEDMNLLEFRSNLIINCSNGPLKRQLKDQEEEFIENRKEIRYIEENKDILIEEKMPVRIQMENLKYNNEYGGFSEDGKEYTMVTNIEKRLPTVWSNILANEEFGTLVTESQGGFTWSNNSRLNKLTSWSNDQVRDTPSEIFYIQDKDNKKTWSMGINPMPDKEDYIVTYGFGYAKYKHTSDDIEQEMEIFVPRKEKVKLSIFRLKNNLPKKRNLRIIYYVKPVLGEDENITNGFLNLRFNRNSNILTIKNLTNVDFNQIVYLSCSEKITSYTGNKKFFLGGKTLANPEALKKVSLNNENGLGLDEIACIEVNVTLEAFESKEMTFCLGSEEDVISCPNISYQYSKIQNCRKEEEEVRKYWLNLVQTIQVKTPLESMNIYLNGWGVYQTIVSRLWARSGFYQSGGAYGFRDQLQDTLGIRYYNPEFMKKQIIKNSSHQFIEGDVEHWWHDETKRGIRTRFSDDLLWLPYMVAEYVNLTNDLSILEIETPYRKGQILEEGVCERYDEYIETNEKETIYIHCIRAIEKSLTFGKNGLPKIGSGDWNDGFSSVGEKGIGESVWLGFFLYEVLNRFIEIIRQKIEVGSWKLETQDYEINNETETQRIEKYKQILEKLKKVLNTNGWDGRWFKRAYTDNGEILGTIQNEECKIDGISQSWSVISGAGDNDKKYISMESLENHLIDKENGIIKLLDPPFEKSKLEPGYIKAYIPGTRENGGQYTHGAIWAIIAEAKLGFGDKAVELFRMINPIEHSRTKEAALKYKVEPYVISADVYGYGNLAGRGGWTWYTGSSSWMIEAGIKYILGLNIEKGNLIINPCISSNWEEYSIKYKFASTIYNIKVKNPSRKNTGLEKFIVNGEEIKEKQIRLKDDGKIYEIECIM